MLCRIVVAILNRFVCVCVVFLVKAVAFDDVRIERLEFVRQRQVAFHDAFKHRVRYLNTHVRKRRAAQRRTKRAANLAAAAAALTKV